MNFQLQVNTIRQPKMIISSLSHRIHLISTKMHHRHEIRIERGFVLFVDFKPMTESIPSRTLQFECDDKQTKRFSAVYTLESYSNINTCAHGCICFQHFEEFKLIIVLWQRTAEEGVASSNQTPHRGEHRRKTNKPKFNILFHGIVLMIYVYCMHASSVIAAILSEKKLPRE